MRSAPAADPSVHQLGSAAWLRLGQALVDLMYQWQLCRQAGKLWPCLVPCWPAAWQTIYLKPFLPALQDTLFYIFYSMPNDEAQLFAADELAHRGWWYHR